MKQNGYWHLYEGLYCPKCRSRRIHEVDEQGKSKHLILHELEVEYEKGDDATFSIDKVITNLKWRWKCRHCHINFRKPTVIEFYADERNVDRMHFGSSSYLTLINKGFKPKQGEL